ncbi:uncharacterized protein LOC110989978 isoform X1 [Acanthaster planci]|uniref:Uncharacterized protein LOC110989978 isoform X1 n=1 Tax=Acanthaster planci TaxID=133434 RepID=A0A8B8A3E3_ACAPL|nr:uncharacterized protein LOC110989978 isoform X1 [Acanthaster planci]
MGTGAGKNPQVGMPLSPTVEYAEKRSKKEGEPVVIDAPALVDLVHGTVRYRNDGDHIIKAGEELKTGYFYHARLEDYSEAATIKPDDQHKFKYVYKGTNSSRGKQLFYVYGIGFNSKDDRFRVRKQYKPKGRGYIWPSSFRKGNHFYYDLAFITQEHDFSESEDEDEDMKADVNPDNMRFCLKDTDTVEVLKKRAAVRLLVPSSNIHISYRDAELGDETIIGKQRTEEDGDFTRFSICLQAV